MLSGSIPKIVVAATSVVGDALYAVCVMDASLDANVGNPVVDVMTDVDHSTRVWLGALK